MFRVSFLLFTLFFSSFSFAGNFLSSFDPLGPTVQTLSTSSGRTVAYIDDGDKQGLPVLFVGGSGTSVRVMRLLEFAHSLREVLHLRLISVERNGFGQTSFDDNLGYQDYAEDVEAVLTELNINRFVAFGISGGSPYLTEVISRNADRVISIHLASALSQTPPDAAQCALTDPSQISFFTENPMIWFGFDPSSPVHQIPGFQDTAFEEAARTFFVAGQLGNPESLFHEFQLYCNSPLADVSQVNAPVYLYYGEQDTTTPPDVHIPVWESKYSNIVKTRLYKGLGHDVQYRHWDQIMIDMAFRRNFVLVCQRGHQRLVTERRAQRLINNKGATLGMCAWANTQGD